MTPKEKAEELVEKFHNAKSDKMSDYSTIYTPTAKVCALIAVDEIMYALEYKYTCNHEELCFYEEVKREIEKL